MSEPTIQKPGVYLTIDVECSMGGAGHNPALRPVSPERAVWGRYDNNTWGIPLIVEILARYELPATFFLDAFIDEQGYPGQSEPICHYLLERGHDVQLHIHPGHKFYALRQKSLNLPRTDQIADLSPDMQFALLEEGADRIRRWTGIKPCAFRAGNMGASTETLKQLAAVGIPIDSSYTFAFAGGQCPFPPSEPYNGSRWYDDVLELAFSGFYQPRLPGIKPAKVLDPMGICFEECRDLIRHLACDGVDAVLILHSFSLFKVQNKQYDGGRPNRIITRRFERLCRWLASTDIPLHVKTFTDLHRRLNKGGYEPKTATPPTFSAPRAIVRKIMQAYNNLYWT
ncbi:MAG: hypothetical protein JW709_12080 [Sedimentisphaerales bacterium]|nr:hypothetical protein [Sedimentisphaerales bacterium]